MNSAHTLLAQTNAALSVPLDNVAGVIAAWAVAIIVGSLGLAIVVLVARGQISLKNILRESGSEEGSASLAKLQFLIFTFVIAMSLFVITLGKQAFPAIDPNILVLLGISAGSSLASASITAAHEVRKLELANERQKLENEKTKLQLDATSLSRSG